MSVEISFEVDAKSCNSCYSDQAIATARFKTDLPRGSSTTSLRLCRDCLLDLNDAAQEAVYKLLHGQVAESGKASGCNPEVPFEGGGSNPSLPTK